MDYFEARTKLEKTLDVKFKDPGFVQELIHKIVEIGYKYSLTFGEIGEVFVLVDKIIKKEITFDELFLSLFEKLGVNQEEITKYAVKLEEILDGIEEIESNMEKLSQAKEQLATANT